MEQLIPNVGSSNVAGQFEKSVIANLSVNHKVKYIKLPPNLKLSWRASKDIQNWKLAELKFGSNVIS